MTMHKFGYNVEMLQTRLIEGIKEKEENLEKLPPTEISKNAWNND